MSEGHAGPVIHSGFARTPAERAERALRASVGRTTAEYLLQHRAALETLRTAFNQLEAKQRQQAATLIQLATNTKDSRFDRIEGIGWEARELAQCVDAVNGDRWRMSFWRGMRWIWTGRIDG